MTVGKKVRLGVIVLVTCCAVGVIIRVCDRSLSSMMTPDSLKNIDQTRAKVLYGTDHEELLEVCREKLARYQSSVPVDAMGNKAVSERHTRRKLHMRILDLEPTFVTISTESINVELCTGFYSVAVMAFPEGVEGHGDMKLIDGLWYHDDGFRKYPNFADHLKKLRVQESAD